MPHSPITSGSNPVVIGGRGLAAAPALIWLEPHEKDAYDRGERVFSTFAGSMMKVLAA